MVLRVPHKLGHQRTAKNMTYPPTIGSGFKVFWSTKSATYVVTWENTRIYTNWHCEHRCRRTWPVKPVAHRTQLLLSWKGYKNKLRENVPRRLNIPKNTSQGRRWVTLAMKAMTNDVVLISATAARRCSLVEVVRVQLSVLSFHWQFQGKLIRSEDLMTTREAVK